jgi:TetR/AcrR family transcriptional repressor of uid operon
MAQQLRAEQTRQKILFAAGKVFDENGYERALIAEIAKVAGVTQGAIYFHFKSKEEIAHAVVQAQHAISRSRAEMVLIENRGAVESLIRITAQFGRDLINDPMVRAGARLNIEKLHFSVQPVQSWDDWAEVLATLFARGIREGDLRDNMNITVYANLVSTAYVGVQTVSEVKTGYANLIEKIFEMWIVVLEGCAKEERLGSLLGCADQILLKGQKTCDPPPEPLV